ncbi:MAG TPA: prolyl oligopeptidase family serine peptidase [Steroidobacteraceae bacterium]|nr:prolyl oligopeptidase family serine peptidase [Steroidobacteraceae bacterium]
MSRSAHAPLALASLAIACCLPCIASDRAVPASSAADRPVHRYLEVQISPDGSYVASIEGDSPTGAYYPDIRDLVIRSVKGGGERRVALPCGRVPQCWPVSPAWTPDGKHVSFALRTPGSHAYSIYTVERDGSRAHRLLDFTGTLGSLKYAPDGTLAMLAVAHARKEVGATQAGAPVAGDLDVAPTEQRIAVLSGGSLEWASPPDLFVYQYDWRPAGRGFVGTAAPGDGDDNWWTAKLYAFAPGTGAARAIYTPADLRQQIADPSVSPDGRTVAFIAGIMSDFGSTGGDIFSLSLDTDTLLDLTPAIQASATSLDWSCRGALTAQLLREGETQIVDLGTGRRAQSPRVLWSGEEAFRAEPRVSRACASGLTALSHESFTAAPEIEVGPLGKWRDLTRLNAGLSLPARVTSIRWRNDGFSEQGWLLLPAGASGKVPLITSIHGGPASAALPTFFGPGTQAQMLRRGWALFLPNPRGSFGEGERFTAANVRDFGHGDLRDVLAGIDAVERQAPIDDARLGVTGGSYGGFMTMWAVTQTHRFKAAVASAGVSNWQSYYGENGIDEWMLPYFGATVYEDPAVYARSSPINFIRNVRTPTFEYVGERDIECPAPQTQEFWHALKALGVPTSIMIYPGEGHGLREPAHSADATARTLAWFEKYLR